MLRPYVICHMLQSADGKVTGDFLSEKTAERAAEIYYELNRNYLADAFASGSETMKESFAGDFFPDLSLYDGIEVEEGDFVAEGYYRFYAVSFDRRGRLGWQNAVIKDGDAGYNNAHIIEVLAENADSRYLAYLRSIGVSYIFAGKDGSDIALALDKLVNLFGICNLLLEGGSILNGAFAEAGVIDELSLVVTPGKAKPTDKSLFSKSLKGTPRFVSAKPYEDGIILMRYSVANEG